MADNNKYYRLDENGLSHLWQRIKLMVSNNISNKVDKVSGKGLSTNDYTNGEKTKLAGIETGAQKNVQPDWSATTGDGAIKNKPSIPTKVSELTNDSNYQTGTNVTSAVSTAISGVSGSVTGTGTYPYVTSATLTGGKLTGKTGDINTVITSLKNAGTLVDRDTAKADATELIANAVSDITSVRFVKVDKLPDKNDTTYTEKQLAGIIFLVPSGTYSTQNNKNGTPVVTDNTISVQLQEVSTGNEATTYNDYDEYIYIGKETSGNLKFEKIGSTSVNLSGYALKSDIPTKLSQLTNDENFVSSGEMFEQELVDMIPALTETQIDTICTM